VDRWPQPAQQSEDRLVTLPVRTCTRLDERGVGRRLHLFCPDRGLSVSPRECARCPRRVASSGGADESITCRPASAAHGTDPPSGVLGGSIVLIRVGATLAELDALCVRVAEVVIVDDRGAPLGYTGELTARRKASGAAPLDRWMRPLPVIAEGQPISKALVAMAHHHARNACIVGSDGQPNALLRDLDAMARLTNPDGT
jgi:hypothetical protein